LVLGVFISFVKRIASSPSCAERFCFRPFSQRRTYLLTQSAKTITLLLFFSRSPPSLRIRRLISARILPPVLPQPGNPRLQNPTRRPEGACGGDSARSVSPVFAVLGARCCRSAIARHGVRGVVGRSQDLLQDPRGAAQTAVREDALPRRRALQPQRQDRLPGIHQRRGRRWRFELPLAVG
jgi:hypothetical protein